MTRWLVLACALAACGDNVTPPIVLTGDTLNRLNQLPGVTAVAMPTDQPGFHYYVLEVTQPVDHGDPGGATFQQEVSLLDRDAGSAASPMIAFTTGYDDYWHDIPWEPTGVLGAHQISIETRFFGTSRPDHPDWMQLTIAQAAADEHAIHDLLAQLYTGPWLASGPSKGGMTAVFYRRFFPDDVVGTIPYVAPLSFGEADPRYAAFLDTVGPDDCRQAVRDAAVDMLANRRAMLVARATADAVASGYTYARIALPAAVESAVSGLEWSFWQYAGAGDCGNVTTTASSDDDVWAFLEEVSPVEGADDDQLAEFEAYDYQAAAQLGAPDSGGAYLASLLQYGPDAFAGAYPLGVSTPALDLGAMQDINTWVTTSSDSNRLLFMYGQWDPWFAGAFTLGNAADSALMVVPQGTHDSLFAYLDTDDQATAFARMARWAGVTSPFAVAAPRVRAVRRPPVVMQLRQLRARP